MALATPLSAIASSVTIDIEDTVAGLGTEVAIHGVEGAVRISVFPPFGPEFSFDAVANGDTAIASLNGTDMEASGTYDVSVMQGDTVLGESQFAVLPDSVDGRNSALQADRIDLQPDGWNSVTVSVILRDQYGNPLADRPVKLVANRAEDIVEEITKQTDVSGEQTFIVSTSRPGQVSLRAIDLLSGTVLPADLTLNAGPAIGGDAMAWNQPQSTLVASAAWSPPAAGWNPYANPYASAYVNPYANAYANPYAMNPMSASLLGNQAYAGMAAGRPLYGQLVSGSLVDHFRIEIPAQIQAGHFENFKVIAEDRSGNIVDDYLGTVRILTSDPDPEASVPTYDSTFLGRDLGVKSFSLGVQFRTPGEQILYVEDVLNPNINGQAAVLVGAGDSSQGSQTIVIANPAQGSYVSTTDLVLKGSGPAYLNLEVTGGLRDVSGTTDASGNFSIDVPLNPELTDHTLRVRDQSKRHDSGNLHVKLDRTPPTVSAFTFSPNRPQEGDDILVEAHLQDDLELPAVLKMTIQSREYELRATGTASGSYQSVISLEEAGTYQVVLKAADAAGNTKEMLHTLEVRPASLPAVRNLRSVSENDTVRLEWEPVDREDVDGYRIYIGEQAGDFSYSRDTGSTSPAATLRGLKAGAVYYFAVTALAGSAESEAKSNTVKSTAQGITLNIRPGNGHLVLSWIQTLGDTSIATYELSYGVAPEKLTEKRMINGNQATYTLRDLLNGVTYYLLLIPVTTTGEKLQTLAVTGQGTPTGQPGFTPTTVEPVPPSIVSPTTPGTTPNHPSAPIPPVTIPGKGKGTVDSGLPALPVWVAGALLLFGGYTVLQRKRSQSSEAAFFAAMAEQYQHRS